MYNSILLFMGSYNIVDLILNLFQVCKAMFNLGVVFPEASLLATFKILLGDL